MTPNIIRFKAVDNTLYRGGKPTLQQLQMLQGMGINTIIDFSTGYGSNPDERTEKENAQSLSINYVHLPFPACENPSQEYIETFFKTMEHARQNEEKVYIHCTHGKDRTGLFAALYKLTYGLDNLDNCIQEMLDMGHDRETNPTLIPFLKNYAMKHHLQKLNLYLKETNPLTAARLLIDMYPELVWLTENVNATPEGVANSTNESISVQLFGQNHVEFERTLTGINCLKAVINNDYEGFTRCQKEVIKLSRENFEKLRNYTLRILPTPQDIDSMIAYTVINDLGKIQSFKENVEQLTQKRATNHDEILLVALQEIPEKIPSFQRLSTDWKESILNGLSADFNLAQFVQAECLPANLSGMKTMTPVAQDRYIIHTFYDVAGAAGHINPNGSLVMTNPVFDGYMLGIKAMDKLKSGATEIATYQYFLSQKAKRLGLKITKKSDFALARLLVISRANTPKDVTDIQQAVDTLMMKDKTVLFNGLLADGMKKPGILLYYAPAFIQNAINAAPDKKINMLKKAYITMGLVYWENTPPSGVRTISLAPAATAIKQNPTANVTGLYKLIKQPIKIETALIKKQSEQQLTR